MYLGTKKAENYGCLVQIFSKDAQFSYVILIEDTKVSQQ